MMEKNEKKNENYPETGLRNTTKQKPKNTKFFYLILILVLALLPLYLLNKSELGVRKNKIIREKALLTARALRQYTVAGGSLKNLQALEKDYSYITIYANKKIDFSTNIRLSGKKLNPDNIFHKSIYDRDIQLARNLRLNKKALEENPGFIKKHGKPFKEISFITSFNKYGKDELKIIKSYLGDTTLLTTISRKNKGTVEVGMKDLNFSSFSTIMSILPYLLFLVFLIILWYKKPELFRKRLNNTAFILTAFLLFFISESFTVNNIAEQSYSVLETTSRKLSPVLFKGIAKEKIPAFSKALEKDINQSIDGKKDFLFSVKNKEIKPDKKEYLNANAGSVFRLSLIVFVIFLFFLLLYIGLDTGGLQNFFFNNYRQYAYIAPAIIGVVLLIFIPFAYAIGLAFFEKYYQNYYFVGFKNFADILGDLLQSWNSVVSLVLNEQVARPRSFYVKFVVTVLWTIVNIFLHTAIGISIALILKNKLLKMKGIYRSLLILPWAIPNYITCLAWYGMFKQNGIINYMFKLPPDYNWFGSFWSAFGVNVATNTWLGFPFMMVIALAALGSIPDSMYEAAQIDGASKWQQFWKITLPHLKPAMYPAIVLGIIWTFNMFNIIYLVSHGDPNNTTDILVVEVYRSAFENGLYGYASAQALLIFGILFSYTKMTQRKE